MHLHGDQTEAVDRVRAAGSGAPAHGAGPTPDDLGPRVSPARLLQHDRVLEHGEHLAVAGSAALLATIAIGIGALSCDDSIDRRGRVDGLVAQAELPQARGPGGVDTRSVDA